MSEIIGRFHPLFVHFPIAILLVACLFIWLSKKAKYQFLAQAVDITLLIGAVSAIGSCITGYLLSQSGEYDEDLVENHQWMGIAVSIVAVIIYFLYHKKRFPKTQLVLTIVLCVLISITGHLGGTLTHGEGYLTSSFEKVAGDSAGKLAKKPIANVQEAGAYADIIQPILQQKCSTCHSSTKQKGGLRLDAPEWILKGGKNGDVIIPGKPDESEMYKRLMLDPLEKHHMPPKAKPQLSELEVTLLHWWIANNNSFDKKVKDIAQTDKIRAALLSLQTAAAAKPTQPSVSLTEIEKAPGPAIEALQQAGVIVLPVSANSNYLQANFVSIKKVDDKTIALLAPIKKQLVWLKLANASFSNESVKVISSCTNLTRLSIENSNITDSGLATFGTLADLQYLNLVGTKITGKGVMVLQTLKHLTNIYLAEAGIDKKDWSVLQKAFPKTTLDSGGYRVNPLTIDTVLVKAPPR
ncbi:MAG: c-type cytochrome domain-containing protein [Ferruginibacter sp.]